MASTNLKSGFFFNGLNELRAFAALAVLFHHIEMVKFEDGSISLFNYGIAHYCIEHIGKNGVYLFFVLSGFLITFLLLKEKEKNGTILFKKFYLRRVFRIWPLYYIILLISFVVIPLLNQYLYVFSDAQYHFNRLVNEGDYSLSTILLYISFLPNVVLGLNIIIVGCSQSWSVGVEEQFYIVWPMLIYLFSRKRVIWVFVCILLFFILFKFYPIFSILKFIMQIIPFEFMAIGSMGGYLYFYYNEKIEVFTRNKISYIIVILSAVVLIIFPIMQLYIQNILLGFIFLILILFTVNDQNTLVYRNSIMSYLGKISYGIYMYHPFIMFLVFPIVGNYISIENPLLYNITIYVLITVLTIFTSHFSYKYIETFFIKIKDHKFKTI